MFGERYFATRERLSAVVRGVRELAEDTGTETGPLADEDAFLAGLSEPFQFVVCGEINAGKSAFINGLFGAPFCPSDVLPTTKEVQWIRYGRREFDERQSECLVHSFRDHEFLLDFSVVDTPGTNGISPEALEAIKTFLPDADLVFFVFPVTNPWGAATWNFVSDVASDLKDRMAVVLQQKDLRNDDDMKVMMGHIAELAVHKIGEAPEVFPVSGLQALEAKQQDPVRTLLYQESGYPALERYVSRKVSGSPKRREVLRGIRDGTAAVLRGIEDRMEIRRNTLDSDQGFLSDIETEVDRERELQAQRLAEKFSGLGEVFGEQAEKAARLLEERTTMWRSLWSLFHKDGTPAEIEKGLIEAVQEAIEGLASDDSEELVDVCRGHWQTVIPRVEERLEMPPPDFEKESQGFAGSKERFSKRLGGAARKAVVAQKIRGMLDSEMEERRGSLRKFVTATLLLIIGAGLLGSLQANLLAVALLVSALVVLTVGLLRARRSSRQLIAWFEERTSACRRPFAEHLAADYQEGVRGFFVEYATMFEGIRRHVADLKMKLKPQLDKWNNLFLELNAIDQDL
ncbi:dynamin family protein [Roseibacillus persicicus]|uniref:dynamin family protein n=1 Tax=Roseibacillus persicicus TaxID=454148 RepID=UPI00398B6DC1